MKISCNVKQGTSLVKKSQTVQIKDKTNQKKPYLEQNISNHKLDRSDKKANTNTSPEMKISCNVKQGTSLVKNSSQTVQISLLKKCLVSHCKIFSFLVKYWY